jgi:hypothetical protein
LAALRLRHRARGTRPGSQARRLSRTLLAAAALAAGVIVLPPGVAAAADPTSSSTLDSPGPGPYTSATTLTLAGTVRRSPAATDAVSLQLTDPTGAAQTIATRSDNGPLSVSWQTSCAYDLATCGQPGSARPARNGTWTLSMAGDTGDSPPASRTFVLTIAPATPHEVSVVPTPGGARVSWQNGGEPDLTGADVLADNKVIQNAPACSGRCATTVPLTAGKHSIAVREHRARCPKCSDDLTSPTSAPAPVTVSAALAAPGLQQGGALSATAQRALSSGVAPGRRVPGQPSTKAQNGEPTEDGTFGAYLPYSNAFPATTDVAASHSSKAGTTSLNWRGVLIPISAALILALASLHLRRLARIGAAITPGGRSRR